MQIGFVALLVTASVVFGLTIFAGWGSGSEVTLQPASQASGKPEMPLQGVGQWGSKAGVANLARSTQLSELQVRLPARFQVLPFEAVANLWKCSFPAGKYTSDSSQSGDQVYDKQE